MAGFGRAIVAGAGGGMGRMFLERLAAAGCDAVGVDVRAGDGVSVADVLDLSEEMRRRLGEVDLALLAVPDGVACRAAAGVARAMAPEAMLVDCTSVKAPYVEAVGDAGSCGLVSVNPLFGPGLDWTGRSIVVTELRRPRFPESLTGFLEASGLRIIRLDAERHDRLAAEAQAQLHAAILGVCGVGERRRRDLRHAAESRHAHAGGAHPIGRAACLLEDTDVEPLCRRGQAPAHCRPPVAGRDSVRPTMTRPSLAFWLRRAIISAVTRRSSRIGARGSSARWIRPFPAVVSEGPKVAFGLRRSWQSAVFNAAPWPGRACLGRA